MSTSTSRIFGKLFKIGMWWRIFYGALRLMLGFALLKIIGRPVIDVVTWVLSHEFIQDPSDVLLTTARMVLSHHSYYVTYFLAFYFIFWGVTDVVLSISLLREQLWSFPISMYVIGLFILYEAFRFLHTHSLILLSVIVIDIFILLLIYTEYKKLQRRIRI